MNEILNFLKDHEIKQVQEDAKKEASDIIIKNHEIKQVQEDAKKEASDITNKPNLIKTYEGANKELFLQEGLDYDIDNQKLIDDSKYKRKHIDEYISGNKQKIPLITHQAYFTASSNAANRKPIDALSLKKSIITTTRLNDAIKLEAEELIKEVLSNDEIRSNQKTEIIKRIKEDHSFKHIIWTNNKDIIPEELKALEGVEVHLIDEMKDIPLYKELVKTLEEAEQNKEKFAEASDIVRLMGVKEYGGIYHDLDYEIYNATAIIKLTRAFHFIGGKETTYEPTFVGNAFFAACKDHPVMAQAVSDAQRNLNLDLHSDTPDYIKYPQTKFNKVIYETGPCLLTIAYLKNANKEGYDDVIMPRNALFNADYAWMTTPESKCHHQYDHNNPPSLFNEYEGDIIETYGADMFCGSWAESAFYETICYNCAK